MRCFFRFNRRERFALKARNGRRPDWVMKHRVALPLSAITAASVLRTSRKTDGGLLCVCYLPRPSAKRYLIRFYRPATCFGNRNLTRFYAAAFSPSGLIVW